MQTLKDVLTRETPPALLIGNGINRYGNDNGSSWEGLLGDLAEVQGLKLSPNDRQSMSNTEFFDILDLARPEESKDDLQREFCARMNSWKPLEHHSTIVEWARKRSSPIITVNFDENLSNSVGAKFFRERQGFTDYYPWGSYFSDSQINDARSNFAIWHAHGMARYFRSVRLGLIHYMGSVQRARSWVYHRKGLRPYAKESSGNWDGKDTWLEVFFFCPLVILGFGFGKDETFFRWLFLERARIHKIRPDWRRPAWFVDTGTLESDSRQAFLRGLNIGYVKAPNYGAIYSAKVWEH